MSDNRQTDKNNIRRSLSYCTTVLFCRRALLVLLLSLSRLLFGSDRSPRRGDLVRAVDHPLLYADHPLFCDIIQMVLMRGCQRGGAGDYERVLSRGSSGGGAKEGVPKRECPRGGTQEGVLMRGCSGGDAQEEVLRRECSGGGAQEGVLRRGCLGGSA